MTDHTKALAELRAASREAHYSTSHFTRYYNLAHAALGPEGCVTALERENERLRAACEQTLSDLECNDVGCWCFTRNAMQDREDCMCAVCQVWRELNEVVPR